MKQYCVAVRKILFRSLWVMAAVALTAPLLMAQAGQAMNQTSCAGSPQPHVVTEVGWPVQTLDQMNSDSSR